MEHNAYKQPDTRNYAKKLIVFINAVYQNGVKKGGRHIEIKKLMNTSS